MSALEFLQAELGHAERHLARLRRIEAQMQSSLAAAGLDEVAVYEKLAGHKAYRQLLRDQLVYQQMWLRAHRALSRLQPAATPTVTPIDAAPAPPRERRAPLPPTRNQPCPCGSTLKYKRCCGKHAPPHLATAA